MKIAVIGYERGLGGRILDADIEVVGRPLDEDQRSRMRQDSIPVVEDYREIWDLVDHPRLYLFDVSMGSRFDEVLDEASQFMEPSDVAIDPSGSHWCDTLRRYRRMRHRSLYHVDVATIERQGNRIMVAGGDKKGVDAVLPFLSRWAAPADALYLGGAGLAHYAQMIEEATHHVIAHARSEAVQLIEAWPSNSDADALRALWPIPGPRSPGRAAWLLDDAMRLEASVPLMAHATMLVVGESLDDERSEAPPARVGPFQHPDEIL